jgi:hypothetical protein
MRAVSVFNVRVTFVAGMDAMGLVGLAIGWSRVWPPAA